MRAFDRLSAKVAGVFSAYLYTRPRRPHLALAVHQLGLVVQESDALLAHPTALPGDPPLDKQGVQDTRLETVRLLAEWEPLCDETNVHGKAMREFRDRLGTLAGRFLEVLAPLLA